jgi:hypothetical protein
MADYNFPTVVRQVVPNADMTPLERLVLTQIFEAEPHGDGLYFFSETGPRHAFEVPATDLKAALAAPAGIGSSLFTHLAECIAGLGDGQGHAEIDLNDSSLSWETILQDIVRRSGALPYLTVVTAFTCSRMRPDGFGGEAVLITADAIKSRSTNRILEDRLAEIEEAAALA